MTTATPFTPAEIRAIIHSDEPDVSLALVHRLLDTVVAEMQRTQAAESRADTAERQLREQRDVVGGNVIKILTEAQRQGGATLTMEPKGSDSAFAALRTAVILFFESGTLHREYKHTIFQTHPCDRAVRDLADALKMSTREFVDLFTPADIAAAGATIRPRTKFVQQLLEWARALDDKIQQVTVRWPDAAHLATHGDAPDLTLFRPKEQKFNVIEDENEKVLRECGCGRNPRQQVHRVGCPGAREWPVGRPRLGDRVMPGDRFSMLGFTFIVQEQVSGAPPNEMRAVHADATGEQQALVRLSDGAGPSILDMTFVPPVTFNCRNAELKPAPAWAQRAVDEGADPRAISMAIDIDRKIMGDVDRMMKGEAPPRSPQVDDSYIVGRPDDVDDLARTVLREGIRQFVTEPLDRAMRALVPPGAQVGKILVDGRLVDRPTGTALVDARDITVKQLRDRANELAPGAFHFPARGFAAGGLVRAEPMEKIDLKIVTPTPEAFALARKQIVGDLRRIADPQSCKPRPGAADVLKDEIQRNLFKRLHAGERVFIETSVIAKDGFNFPGVEGRRYHWTPGMNGGTLELLPVGVERPTPLPPALRDDLPDVLDDEGDGDLDE